MFDHVYRHLPFQAGVERPIKAGGEGQGLATGSSSSSSSSDDCGIGCSKVKGRLQSAVAYAGATEDDICIGHSIDGADSAGSSNANSSALVNAPSPVTASVSRDNSGDGIRVALCIWISLCQLNNSFAAGMPWLLLASSASAAAAMQVTRLSKKMHFAASRVYTTECAGYRWFWKSELRR